MKKQIMALSLAGLFSTAFAEQNGFFVGVGGGFSGMSENYETTDYVRQNAPAGTIYASKVEQSISGGSLNVIAGYKNMFGYNQGARFYLNYDYNPVTVEIQEAGSGTRLDERSASYNVIGLNADYLYNFSESWGFFVGANLGAIKWSEELYKFDPGLLDAMDLTMDYKDSWGFYAAAQLGARYIFGATRAHSVELAVKVPFTDFTNEYLAPTGEKMGERKLSNTYNASLRYVFSF